MKKAILILSVLGFLSIQSFGQTNSDSTKSKKWYYNLGASNSLVADRFVNTVLSDDAQKLHSLSYNTNHYRVNPQYAFFFMVGKHSFINKTELIFSHVRTQFTYSYLAPPDYLTQTHLLYTQNTFHFLDLKDKVGVKYKRLCFYGGFFISFLISGKYYYSDYNIWPLKIKNHLRFGAEMEIDYFLWKKYFYIGIGSSITNKITNETHGLFNKYRILSFQLTLGSKFIKDKYFK